MSITTRSVTRIVPEKPAAINGTVFLRARSGALLCASDEDPVFRYCDPRAQTPLPNLSHDAFKRATRVLLRKCESLPFGQRRVLVVVEIMNIVVQNTWFLAAFPMLRCVVLKKLDEFDRGGLFPWSAWFKAQIE